MNNASCGRRGEDPTPEEIEELKAQIRATWYLPGAQTGRSKKSTYIKERVHFAFARGKRRGS